MHIPNPFQRISLAGQKRALLILAALTLALMAALNLIGGPLGTEAAPLGIISFELAGDLATAQRILRSWDQTAQVHAGLSLGLDYLFMAAYSTAIALGCARVAAGRPRLAALGLILAWSQWLAALLDAIENYALIQLLLGAQDAAWPALARWCALFKFSIVAAGLLYLLLAVGAALLTRRRR